MRNRTKNKNYNWAIRVDLETWHYYLNMLFETREFARKYKIQNENSIYSFGKWKIVKLTENE